MEKELKDFYDNGFLVDTETFCKRFKNRREQLKLSQSDVARRINKTKQAISKIENRKMKNIQREQVKLYSEVLECTEDFLVGFSDNAKLSGSGLIKTIAFDYQYELKKKIMDMVFYDQEFVNLIIECNKLNNTKKALLAEIIRVFLKSK